MTMAQSNNVQREPSMEEILASIRRIIEDSDTTRKGAETEAEPASADKPAEASNVHAFRVSLQDDSAQLGSYASEVFHDDDPGAGDAFRQEAVSFSVSDFDLSDVRAQTDSAVGDEIELGLKDFGDESPASARPGEGSAESSPAIISEHAGRQVAASFGELSAAFESRSRKSFDEIAAEMMRPMLQDWLDNNLPHLVERLVREEIERIARGGTAPR